MLAFMDQPRSVTAVTAGSVKALNSARESPSAFAAAAWQQQVCPAADSKIHRGRHSFLSCSRCSIFGLSKPFAAFIHRLDLGRGLRSDGHEARRDEGAGLPAAEDAAAAASIFASAVTIVSWKATAPSRTRSLDLLLSRSKWHGMQGYPSFQESKNSAFA